MKSAKDVAQAKQTKLVALVLLVTMFAWMGVQYIGGQIGLAPKYALLADLFALAGFIWALVVTYQIWRKRQA